MPGLVAFRRRWSIGSDDLAVPGIFFFVLHAIWLTVLSVALGVSDLSADVPCQSQLWEYILGYLVILCGCLLLEACIVGVSMRGTILETAPREATQYLIYLRLGVMAVEMAWLVVGVIWLVKHYHSCHAPTAKEAMIGAVICNWISVTSAFIMVWCTFDPAGRSWVKMKNYQRTMKDGQKKFQYKRSGSHQRNWRQRKVLRAYRDSWDSRCRMLFCCMDRSDRHQNSFADIAQLLSEFFRDLDVVPSDIIAGLVLLRKVQKMERNNIVKSNSNDTYEFLSGVKVTPTSTFLALNQPDQLAFFKDVIHYMRLAMSIYGWPVFMMQHSSTGCCRLCPYLKGCCKRRQTSAEIVEDNCCLCNLAATQKMAPLEDMELVYVTYHVDVGETPFMVAVDHHRQTVVVCIRGTMSTKDVVTDLECEGEPIPTTPLRDDWLGHRGMVQTARYIRDKMASEHLLERAFGSSAERGTASYRLVLVGHSLGAGTAAILAILLRDQHPDLRCFAYSPPGGLLSMPAVEYTKEFITSVVVGKDVVPRIGLHQLEQLRSDLMDVIKHSEQAKWRVIGGGMCCTCGRRSEDASAAACGDLVQRRLAGRQLSAHPSDSTIALTVHQPLYPPGRVMHVVRHHAVQRRGKKGMGRSEPVYQAIWVENDSFDEVLISPVMIQDHMPDKVLQALQKFVAVQLETSPFSAMPAPAPTAGSADTGSDAGEVGADRDDAGLSFTAPRAACCGDSEELPGSSGTPAADISDRRDGESRAGDRPATTDRLPAGDEPGSGTDPAPGRHCAVCVSTAGRTGPHSAVNGDRSGTPADGSADDGDSVGDGGDADDGTAAAGAAAGHSDGEVGRDEPTGMTEAVCCAGESDSVGGRDERPLDVSDSASDPSGADERTAEAAEKLSGPSPADGPGAPPELESAGGGRGPARPPAAAQTRGADTDGDDLSELSVDLSSASWRLTVAPARAEVDCSWV